MQSFHVYYYCHYYYHNYHHHHHRSFSLFFILVIIYSYIPLQILLLPCQTQLLYILLVSATSYGLSRPSSGQNIYKNLNASAYHPLFVNIMGSHLYCIVFYKQCLQ
jgi:hypothetical protein